MIKSNLPKGWNLVKVKEVAKVNELSIDKNFRYAEIEYIDVASVENRQILNTQKISVSESPSRAKRIVRNNDILISTVRPNLKHFAFIQKAKENTIASTGFAVITVTKANPKYLYYYLTTDQFTDFLSQIADTHTSTYPAFNPDIIENADVLLPPEQEQTKIANMLGILDDKIALNRAMNSTLEAIGQALFKHWFIDFEFPNEEGKPYKSSGGAMVDSELGMMPKGWGVGTLGSLGEFKNGVNYSREETGDTSFSIINVRDLVANNFILESSLDKLNMDYKKAEDYLLKEGDIVIARSASPGETIFIFSKIPNLIYSGFSIRYRPNDLSYANYFFCILQNLKESLFNISDGTTLKNINQETLKSVKLIVPDNKTLSNYNMDISTIYEKIIMLLNENQNLSKIRDALLPKLMSGEIRVKVKL